MKDDFIFFLIFMGAVLAIGPWIFKYYQWVLR